jgi:hypothetical protein
LLSGLGLGACLADDMGLGKTIQVLSLLLVQRQQSNGGRLPPCLLVAPASLLANWATEIERFAPDLKARIVHPSAMTADAMKQFTQAAAAELDLVITSYGTLLRMPVLSEPAWRLVILDQATSGQEPECQADPGRQGAESTCASSAISCASRGYSDARRRDREIKLGRLGDVIVDQTRRRAERLKAAVSLAPIRSPTWRRSERRRSSPTSCASVTCRTSRNGCVPPATSRPTCASASCSPSAARPWTRSARTTLSRCGAA